MKRVVLFLTVAALCATITWVDTAARDTPWGEYPYRESGDDHPWGGEQVRPGDDDGPTTSDSYSGTTTRFFLSDLLNGIFVDFLIDWHSSSYRPHSITTGSGTGDSAVQDQQPTQTTTGQRGN